MIRKVKRNDATRGHFQLTEVKQLQVVCVLRCGLLRGVGKYIAKVDV